ncbi:uncharacterized protein CCOS01_05277 [Colletotrichum costaricense]|uniref:Ketoreductase domain-containing protein n=1 Tax=Colletotrichum costaricense TaxID=1209916 RepID=A0AAJ0E301_9PEZI|nr:uncharacterized protein CCOS01_05277 [Colletotrichum costaricense]KAK1530174.1 hypothetical protein CCOS01_05277 [Colletotrichum costaricense]
MSYTKANHNASYPAISASNPANSTAGKVVLITGAGSGIGQAAATSFAPASAKALILIGRRTEPLTKTAAIISQKGPDVQVRLHGADINDVKTLKSVMAETVSTFGQIGIVIHAAGMLLALGPISTMPVEELWKALEVKIKEKSAGSKPVLVSLNTAGILMPPIPGMGGYIVSKAVLPKLVEYLAAENPDKLRIVTIHPSLIRTPMAVELEEAALKFPYDDEAVKVAAWGNSAQCVACDDEETFQLKSEYAQSGEPQDPLLLVNVGMKDDLIEFVDIPNEQCRWTNCNVGCAPGWAIVPRSDPGARGKEYIFDQTGCDGTAFHTFCCPATWKQPKCGWYTHNNGKCTGSYPNNMVLIGSKKKYCNNGQFQAACCTKDTQRIKLYTLYELGAFSKCDDQASCPAQSGDQSMKTLLASSSIGIGGAEVCKKLLRGGRMVASGEHKLCCNTSNKKMTFSDCEWYSNTGSGPAISREDFCAANCPNDRVRVAMDLRALGCSGGGKERCCIPNYYETVEVENEKPGVWRDSLKVRY